MIDSKIKVFGIGLSRTGTTYLNESLEELGIKSKHYVPEFFFLDKYFYKTSLLPKLNIYERIILKKYVKSMKAYNQGFNLFQDYQGFTDLPTSIFYEELYDLFPQAFFIYTYREESEWLSSMEWMIENGPKLWNWGILDYILLKVVYGTHEFDSKKLISSFRLHHENVQKFFKDKPNFISINISNNELNINKIAAFLNAPAIKNINISQLNKNSKKQKSQIVFEDPLPPKISFKVFTKWFIRKCLNKIRK